MAGEITSHNKTGDILFDPVLATAILDRFMHHCSFISIERESYQMIERALITAVKRRGSPKKETTGQAREIPEVAGNE